MPSTPWMFHVEHWRHQRFRDQQSCRDMKKCHTSFRRGQSLVEFLLFVTILLMLLAGVYDLGSLLNGHLAVTYAARQGALTAASVGINANADCDTLAAIALNLAQLQGVTVTRIAIYEPGNDGLPLGGLGTSAFADVYTGDPGCENQASPPTAQATNWPATSRTTDYAPPSLVGVEIDYTYTWQSNLIALGAISLSDHVVVPIAPE